MRVIICGAGQVGYNIAAYLSREDNDVTVIDNDPQTIAKVNEDLDVKGITGHASNPDVLNAAGASDADMIVAVTHTDEVNMIACQIAHSLFNIPKKIARVRERAYLDPAWSNLFSRSHLPIDVIISPEIEIARTISMRLSVPGTTYVIPLADGLVHLCGVICESDCPLVNTPLRQLTELFGYAPAQIVAILRQGRTIIPTADEQMQVGDEVYFVADTAIIPRALTAFGHHEKKARNVILLGGGSIGLCLARELQNKHPDIGLKIIEKNKTQAVRLSEELEGIVILNGDGLDRAILEEANIAETETLVAVTNDDEANILGSLLARQYGCNRTITLVNKNTYNILTASLGLGAIVSPRAITVSTIMQHVRRGRIRAVHNLRDGFAEVIEAEASEGSALVNTPIHEIPFPDHVIVGAVVREGKVMMPRPETVIRPGDLVIILAAHGQARKVEKMFSVHVDLF